MLVHEAERQAGVEQVVAGGPLRVAGALSIGGADPTGGAGIAADLKAFARCGLHGAFALTALTAQSSHGVKQVLAVAPELLVAQVRELRRDVEVLAVKVGMVPNGEVATAVAELLEGFDPAVAVVVDPVLSASSGGALADKGARAVMVERIFPLAHVVTPNWQEALQLAGCAAGAPPGEEELLARLLALGPAAALVTGGHNGDSQAARLCDLLLQDAPGAALLRICGERVPGRAGHGSGCTHSALLAAALARGLALPAAAEWARALSAEAIACGLARYGAGGPVELLAAAMPDPPSAGGGYH